MKCFGVLALVGLGIYWLSQRCAVASEPRVLVSSWYGRECAGKITASGEIFNPRKFTAASWQYYGKALRVTHKGKSVLVVVNDKGPNKKYLKTRSLDLSRAAFEALSPLSAGLIQVTVEVLPL